MPPDGTRGVPRATNHRLLITHAFRQVWISSTVLEENDNLTETADATRDHWRGGSCKLPLRTNLKSNRYLYSRSSTAGPLPPRRFCARDVIGRLRPLSTNYPEKGFNERCSPYLDERFLRVYVPVHVRPWKQRRRTLETILDSLIWQSLVGLGQLIYLRIASDPYIMHFAELDQF